MATMTAPDVANLIREHGVVTVARTVTEFNRRFVAGLKEGWDLTGWEARQTGGAVAFVRYDDAGAPVAPTVLAVNGPESDRARWETVAREAGYPDTIVVMEDLGRGE